jgi:hypothetical protein
VQLFQGDALGIQADPNNAEEAYMQTEYGFFADPADGVHDIPPPMSDHPPGYKAMITPGLPAAPQVALPPAQKKAGSGMLIAAGIGALALAWLILKK